MRGRGLWVVAVLAVGGCGGDDDALKPDRAKSILPSDPARKVRGAVERIDAGCSGDGTESLRRSGLRSLEAVATRRPHAIVSTEHQNLTMIQYLEFLEDTYPDCGVAKDLRHIADELRGSP